MMETVRGCLLCRNWPVPLKLDGSICDTTLPSPAPPFPCSAPKTAAVLYHWRHLAPVEATVVRVTRNCKHSSSEKLVRTTAQTVKHRPFGMPIHIDSHFLSWTAWSGAAGTMLWVDMLTEILLLAVRDLWWRNDKDNFGLQVASSQNDVRRTYASVKLNLTCKLSSS